MRPYPDAGLGRYLRARITFLRAKLRAYRRRIADETDPARRAPWIADAWVLEQRLGLLNQVKRDFEATQQEQTP